MILIPYKEGRYPSQPDPYLLQGRDGLFAVDMDLPVSVSKFRGKTALMVFKIGNKGLIVLKIKLGGNLLYVFIRIGKRRFCLGQKKAIDQLLGANPEASLTDSCDVIGGITEMPGNTCDGKACAGVSADPLIYLFRPAVVSRSSALRNAANLGKYVQKKGVDKIIGSVWQIICV